jgi:hypothetical protein
LAVRPLNWDEIIDKNDNDENKADSRAPSGGRSYPSNGNDNDNSKGEEDIQGSVKGTGKEKGAMDGMVEGKGKGKGKGKEMQEANGKGLGHGRGKGIDKHIPGPDDESRTVVSEWLKKMYEALPDTEGELEQVYVAPGASPAV